MSRHFHLRGFYILLILLLPACGNDASRTSPVAEIGTRAFLSFDGSSLAMDITDIEGEIVRTAVSLDQDIVFLKDYYLGLFPVSGTQGNQSFYFSFDPKDLMSIFPLTPGKSTRFSGTLTVDHNAIPILVAVQVNVLENRDIILTSGIEPVKVVQVKRQFQTNTQVRSRIDTYYYSENLGFNLGVVSGPLSNPSKWYVTDIAKPGMEQDSRNPRRPGTVMI